MRPVRAICFGTILGLTLVSMPAICSAQAPLSGDVADAETNAVPVDSPLLREPTTPEETFDAVILILDLARPKLARRYLDKFLSLNPDDDMILKLRDKHGPATFLKLSNIEELQPSSIRLLERVNSVFSKWASDPTRVDELISMLAESPARREIAIIQLREAGDAIIPRMLEHLRVPKDVDRTTLLYTISRLGRAVVPPLVGALETPDASLRSSIADVLGWIGASEVVPFLWYPAYGADQPEAVQTSAREALNRILNPDGLASKTVSSVGAADDLHRRAEINFRGEYTGKVSEENVASYWRWDSKVGTVVKFEMNTDDAAQLLGSRFAYESLALAPERIDSQALLLAFALAGARKSDWEGPLPTGPNTAHDMGLLAGADVVKRTLHLALDNHNVAAALGALQVLGQIGTRHDLRFKEATQSPLLAALNYPNQRVQFAAANTILQLDPIETFRGHDRVVEILVRALAGDGEAQAAVVDPNEQRGSVTGSLMQELGYSPLLARTGRDGFVLASTRGDVEVAIIHANSIRWELSQTIANFRADARTASIPIAIYGPNHLRLELERKAKRYPLTTVVVESSTPEAMNRQLRPYLIAMATPQLTQEQRAEHMRIAAFWLAHIASGQKTEIFDLEPAEEALFSAATIPDLASDCLLALGAIPTGTAQKRFSEIAINQSVEMEIRSIAAQQLAFHIQRFGLLLSDSEVREIHSALQSAKEPALRTSLASVVGSLKPNAKRVGEQLLDFSKKPQTAPPAAGLAAPSAQP